MGDIFTKFGGSVGVRLNCDFLAVQLFSFLQLAFLTYKPRLQTHIERNTLISWPWSLTIQLCKFWALREGNTIAKFEYVHRLWFICWLSFVKPGDFDLCLTFRSQNSITAYSYHWNIHIKCELSITFYCHNPEQD